MLDESFPPYREKLNVAYQLPSCELAWQSHFEDLNNDGHFLSLNLRSSLDQWTETLRGDKLASYFVGLICLASIYIHGVETRLLFTIKSDKGT